MYFYPLILNHIMIFTKHLFLFFFLFPLINASHPKPCTIYSCGLDVDVRFPFWLFPNHSESCGYPGFNLRCTDGNQTSIILPNSGSFLVREIDYENQRIRLNDPRNCLAKRLLTFNASGSPFSLLDPSNYTLLSCPNSYIESSSFKPIHCLGNDKSMSMPSSFIVMQSWLTNLVISPCKNVKTLLLPDSWSLAYTAQPGNHSGQDLWLQWNSPDCRDCERKTNSRCWFVNNNSLQVKCFSSVNSGHNSPILQLLIIICLCLVGPLMGLTLYLFIVMFKPPRASSSRQATAARFSESEYVTQQPNTGLSVTLAGLDESTIESYKKVELGESKRLPTGSNDTTCSICLSEYVSKETVRCLPECEHCFHMECIDVWLKLHSSCPLCRSNPSPVHQEKVGCLPECEHCFHMECIDVWLKLHSYCPLCRSNPSPVHEGWN